MITVADLLAIAFPPTARVLAGEEGLDREVTWATRLRPTAPAFGQVEHGELILLTDRVLNLLDDRLTLADVVRTLASFNVAAIAIAGEVPTDAVEAALDTGATLIHLPDDTDLSRLERDASTLVQQRRREAQRLGQETGRRLMEMAIAGESLQAMVRALSEISGRPVALESRDGRLLAFQPAPDGGVTAEAIEPAMARSRAAALAWFRSAAGSSPADPPAQVIALDDDHARVAAPIIGRDGLLGGLSLIVPGPQGLPVDRVSASRGAAACAVVLAREHAAATARREIELDVLDELLDGALRSEVTLLQQAKRLGHDLTQPHVVIVARIDQTGVARARDDRWALLEETLARRGERVLWRVRNTIAEIVWPAPTPAAAEQAAAELHAEIAQGLPTLAAQGLAVSLALGRPRAGLAGIRSSYQEARQALTLGRRLNGPGKITRFDELGVYRLIFAAENLAELREFHDENLDTLLAYDREHGGELIRTLEAFFAAKCSPKEASSMLGVHRNTILYRLDRIRDITGVDIDDADVRLRLHLALCAHIAVFAAEPDKRR
jgi:PucR family transcriptional regulator, purine catabolism regulatory protein